MHAEATRPPSRIRRAPAPRLLAVVYLVCLVLVLGMTTALAIVVSGDIRATAIASSLESDRSLAMAFADDNLTLDDSGALALAGDVARMEEQLGNLVGHGIQRLKVYAPDGTVLVSDEPALRGVDTGPSDGLREALAGRSHSSLETAHTGQEGELAALGPVLEEYLPLKIDGRVVGVFEVYRDATPILDQVDRTGRSVLLVIAIGSAILTVLLYLVYHQADARLLRQTAELLESTRRDPLTGLLTHGEVVSRLTDEVARAGDGRVALALIDVDDFGIFNLTHGHDAGDRLLVAVAGVLRDVLPAGSVLGRYGPDEFLAVAPPADEAELSAAIERVRARLAGAGHRVDDAASVPVTVSAGLAWFPHDGDGATELLSRAAVALSEAKQAGGDAIRIAEPVADQPGVERTSFDVLQGLIVAVDTKDRYTKRHSEDVARYAAFLAERLELPVAFRRALYVAGLLHDVGKIGVPDQILRKPARLTDEEYAVVRQHATLGHTIVRDLPELDVVKAGIRTHHERWDGTGYPEGLRGTEIPLVGRILAIADAFSAMTITRSYRTAIPVREALMRLEEAAGTQLDPSLVSTFVLAMATSPDAPMPATPAPVVAAPQPSPASPVSSPRPASVVAGPSGALPAS